MPRPGQPLTAREKQVLAHRAAGLSGPAIAKKLGLSADTVKEHLRRINEKLAANGAASAVLKASRRGELDHDLAQEIEKKHWR